VARKPKTVPIFRRKSNFDPNELTEILRVGYMSLGRGSNFKTKTSFSPSVIGGYYGTCPRYWFLAFKGAMFDEQANITGLLAMSNGVSVHDRIQSVLSTTGLDVQVEVEVTNDDPPIRGFADLVVDWNGVPVVGEIKTAKHEVYTHRASSGKPLASHLLQVLIYMRILNTKEGFLYYESKNTHDFVILPVIMTEAKSAAIDKVFEWMKVVHYAYEEDTIPKRVFNKSDAACKYCPLAAKCWKEDPEPFIEIPALSVPKP
jgi:CRISPR/Cas system-associated exonuclease Cas4 (RecB family)